MGSGSFSTLSYTTRCVSKDYESKSKEEIFANRNINNAMDPYKIDLRESCDSDEHPNTVPIIIALDVTGSMGSIPHHLVKNGLPTFMDAILKAGVTDPQVLFLGIGDHECDSAPLQVGQFESSDALLEKWLTSVYLEGGGGGNDGESYLLAWYFSGYHTKIDSFDKRGKKGFLFTIGDEPTLTSFPKHSVKKIMGSDQPESYSADVLLSKASEKYHVFHIHVRQTRAGSMQSTMDGWKQLLHDGLIIVERKEDIPMVISDTILKHSAETIDVSVEQPVILSEENFDDEEMML